MQIHPSSSSMQTKSWMKVQRKTTKNVDRFNQLPNDTGSTREKLGIAMDDKNG